MKYLGHLSHKDPLRDRYYAIMKQQKEARGEDYPELDVEAIWSTFLGQEGIGAPVARRELATFPAQLYRAISRKRLQLYPEVTRVLDALRPTYRMALVSDREQNLMRT